MTPDYDLVILGGSEVARYAAAQAARRHARVALVEPNAPPAVLHHQTLLYESLYQGRSPQDPPQGSIWPELKTRAQEVLEVMAESNLEQSLDLLAAAGVDVVLGQAQFLRQGLGVNGRILRARSFLLAPAVAVRVPAIAGLIHAGLTQALTPYTLWQQETLPDRLIILGSSPTGVELAQALTRLGVKITLISSTRLLPYEDQEAAGLIQAQLEAEGVTLLTEAIVHSVQYSDPRVSAQAGDVQAQLNEVQIQVNEETLTADALLLATAPHLDLTALSLEAIGVQWTSRGIRVNRKLQTSSAHVYACGEAIGGYSSLSLAKYEAAIAVQNALFLPFSSVEYGSVPLALFTRPELARVGLTEAQARQRYAEVLIAKQYVKTLVKAQIQQETTGFCKLIASRDGELLGAHWVGAAASEGIGTIALAMNQRMKLGAIAQLPQLSPTFTELLQQTAQRQPQSRDWLENWFSFRRYWSS